MLGAVAVPRLNWMRAKTYFEVEVIKQRVLYSEFGVEYPAACCEFTQLGIMELSVAKQKIRVIQTEAELLLYSMNRNSCLYPIACCGIANFRQFLYSKY